METTQGNSFTAPLINKNTTVVDLSITPPLINNQQKGFTIIRDADKITVSETSLAPSWLGRHQQLMMLPVLALGMTIGATLFNNHIYKMSDGLLKDLLGISCLVVIPASSIIVYQHHTSK